MSIQLQADARGAGQTFLPHWNFCVGAGRANEGLRADWQKQLELVVHECGFGTVHFHGLFHDDMIVYREENGEAMEPRFSSGNIETNCSTHETAQSVFRRLRATVLDSRCSRSKRARFFAVGFAAARA